MTQLAEEKSFEIDGRKLAAKLWQEKGRESVSTPIIALHGWCDNAASFDYLGPVLQSPVLAIDLAGHGKSYHRGSGGSYTIWSDIYDIYAIAKEMQWQEFHLLGHSRGAMIATIFASAFPENIQQLFLIEGLLPPPEPIENFSEQLRSSIKSKWKFSSAPKNSYKSVEAAIEAREKGLFHIAKVDAAALAERGVRQQHQIAKNEQKFQKNQNNYVWHYDALLKCPSEVKLSIEQLKAIATALASPVTLVTGKQSGFEKYEKLLEEFKKMMTINHHRLDGHHHLHMSENSERVANIINTVLTKFESERPGGSSK